MRRPTSTRFSTTCSRGLPLRPARGRIRARRASGVELGFRSPGWRRSADWIWRRSGRHGGRTRRCAGLGVGYESGRLRTFSSLLPLLSCPTLDVASTRSCDGAGHVPERALVLQRWLSEHGIDKDVVVGVARSPDFRAHAWLEGETVDEQFQELMRLPAPSG